jgi:hypothetical protein
MAKAEILAGACGFSTSVEAIQDGKMVNLKITSDCASIQRLAQELTQVNPYEEISFRKAVPQSLALGMKHCAHPACPVPVGIIKAIEVEAKLALPVDVNIHIEIE